MSNTEWSATYGDFYCNLSQSSKHDMFYVDVEIDSQTIVSSESENENKAMKDAIAKLDVAIENLMKLKSSMVFYMIDING